MPDLINQAKDLFSEEIDAFAGTYQDLKDLVHGKPVHTSAQKWAKRAVTAATTVIPVGLSAKAAIKSAKIAGKSVKAAAHVTRKGRQVAKAKNAPEVNQLKKQRDKLSADAHKAKVVGKQVRRTTKVAYAATGDNDARKQRNQALTDLIPVLYDTNPQELKNMAARKRKIISDKMKKNMAGGAADAAIKQLSRRKYKKEPITADDVKVMGAQIALGALKGARPRQKHNDKSWYTKLGTDLVGLNFAAVDRLGFRDDIFISPLGTPDKARLTTDAIIDLMLTVPSGSSDPFTVASAKLANEMRLHSGANTIYNPADIMEYLINGRSIMAGIVQAARILMSLNNVDPCDVDAYKKYTLMALGCIDSSSGTRYKTTRQQAANCLTDLNAMIKAVQMMIPINMPIMRRTEWLFTNAFADGSTRKHGVKMFIAETLPKATKAADESITITQESFLNGDLPSLLNSLRQRVNDFVVKQVHMAIAGDIMKVYGRDAFWAPALLKGDEAMPVLYDEEALTQIQNMTVLSSPGVMLSVTASTQNITNGSTSTSLKFLSTGQDSQYRLGRAYARYKRRLVQTYKSQPDGGDTLELTRLTTYAMFDDPGDNGSIATDVICGTEVVVYYGYATSRRETTTADYVTILREQDVLSDANALIFAGCWAMDDWGPLVITDYDPTTHELALLFDVETWAAFSTEQMASFHYIAGVSLYTNDVPILRPTI